MTALDRLARELTDQGRRLSNLEKARSLARSALVDSTIPVFVQGDDGEPVEVGQLGKPVFDDLAKHDAEIAAAEAHIEAETERLDGELAELNGNLEDARGRVADVETGLTDVQSVADTAAATAAAAAADAAGAIADAFAAKDAAEDALGLATTADGRMTVGTASPTASDAAGKPIGAVWEVRSGSTVPRRYVLTAPTTWTQVKIGQDFIGENAIGSAQIGDAAIGTAHVADAAITNAKIGDLDVGKLTASVTRMKQAAVERIIGDAAYFGALLANSVVIAGDPTNKVGAIMLEDGAVTAPKINATSELWAKIVNVAGDATIGGDLLVNGTVDVDKLRVNSAFANAVSANLATLNTAWIKSANIIELAANKIRSGVLAVGTEITVGSLSGAHTKLTSDGLKLHANPDGSGVREVAQMGTDTAAVWSVIGPKTAGESAPPVLAQVTPEGDLVGQTISAGQDFELGGVSLSETLDLAPKGIMGHYWASGAAIPTWSNATYGLFGATWTLIPGRRYKVTLQLHLQGTQNDSPFVALRHTAGTTLPTINSPITAEAYGAPLGPYAPVGGSKYETQTFTFVLHPNYQQPAQYNILATIRNWNAAREMGLRSGVQSYIVVEDLGPTPTLATMSVRSGGGTPYSGSAPGDSTPAQRQTKTYSASWVRSWKLGGQTTDGLYHGRWSGDQRMSYVRLPDALRSDVMNAQSVEKVEVWLECQHTRWGSGLTARIGTTNLTAPTAMSQLTGSYPDTSHWRAGDKKWIELTRSTHKDRLIAGNVRGLIIGEGATTEADYGIFRYAASAVKIRVTYTKQAPARGG